MAVIEMRPATPRPTRRQPPTGLLVLITIAAAAALVLVLADPVSPAQGTGPRPDQYLYIHDGSYQAWLSMDGTHDGKIMTDPNDSGLGTFIPGCVNGEATGPGHYGGTVTNACSPHPAEILDAPTTPAGWRVYIDDNDGNVSTPQLLAKDVDNEAEFDYLTPRARAALLDPDVLPADSRRLTTLVEDGARITAVRDTKR